MKKTLLFAVVASSAVNAQIREKGEIEIAPFIGISSANYYGDVGVLNESVQNPYFGVNADFFMSNRWSFRTGIEHQKMGSTAPLYNDYGTFSIREKLNFISVPIHANYHFGSTRKWYLNFGPTVSFLTKATSNGVDIKHGMNSVQMGLGLGIGYKFEINENFSIGIDHQEYISVVNNLEFNSNRSNPYIGNYFGSFSVKAIFKLGSKSTSEN